MCGRFSLVAPAEELVEVFDVPDPVFDYRPRYNVAPGQDTVVIARDRRGRRMGLLNWGLIPGWTDEPGRGFVNARGESVAETPSFRDAFVRRRCIVVADGFYEWKKGGEGAGPHWFRSPSERLLAMAGIWESWQRRGSEPRHTFALLTVAANPDVKPVHHRMPVLLPSTGWQDWLGGETPVPRLYELIAPAVAGSVVGHAVSTAVNDPTRDGPDLIRPVTPG